MSPRRILCLSAGPAVFTGITFVHAPWLGLGYEAQSVLAVAAWMVVWWVAEAVPLAVTALLPLVLFPITSVLGVSEAAAPYADQIIFLFLGGFLVAGAVESSGLHRRIALLIVGRTGDNPRLIIGGFMVAGAFLSMWISNSATAIMMLPVAISVSHRLAADTTEATRSATFEKALLLGIAYATSIGGVGTLIGTPPNLVLAAASEEILGRPIDFARWLAVGMPLVAVLLPLAWLYLTRVAFKVGSRGRGAVQDHIRRELRKLGPLSPAEKLVLVVFLCTASAWVFRSTKEIGGLMIPGLDLLWPGIKDSTIAIAAAISLFALPGGTFRADPVLCWEDAKRVPWDVILLFGGGLCLALAFKESGLDVAFASALAGGELSLFWIVALVVGGTVILTEFTSNTATAAMLMPLLAAAALTGGHDPLGLMVAGAVACSFAFCLPVATPPNAVVYGSGRLTIHDMIRAGLAMNLLAFFVWIVLYFLVASPILVGVSQ